MSVDVKILNSRTAAWPVILSWPINLKSQLLIWFMACSVLLSAFSLVYVRGVNRQLISEWQSLQSTSQKLYTEKDQLLLEGSAWTARARISNIAVNRLGMVVPKNSRIVLV